MAFVANPLTETGACDGIEENAVTKWTNAKPRDIANLMLGRAPVSPGLFARKAVLGSSKRFQPATKSCGGPF